MSDETSQTPADVTSDGADTPSDSTSEARDRDRLIEWLTDIKRDVQDRGRPIVRGKKALEQLCRSGAFEQLDRVVKQTDRLREADFDDIDLEEERMQAVGRLDAHIKRRQRELRMRFARALDREARRREITAETLSESPLVIRIPPFVVTTDFDRETATLEYAKETLDEVDLGPPAVLAARDDWVDTIRKRSVDSETFFRWLKRAYELTVEARGATEGDRVDLVDLRAPLGLLAGDVNNWRREDGRAPEPYPKWLFSYQLKHLRRDQMLEHNGLRIDLGTATGGSTENKQNVLFVRSGRESGQYYLSIRFTDAPD